MRTQPLPSSLAASERPPSSVAVIVPTYREVENLPHLVERLRLVRERSGLALELLLMDDDSRDGSEELVRSLDLPWVRMVVRTRDRGLGQAVLEGLRLSASDVLVVMDADLSHPPEKIPELVRALDDGADMAIGSRFVDGGSTDDDWGIFRWLNNRVASLLVLPLTRLKDPMSGFFALRRATFEAGRDFDPVGYKIGLELLLRCGCRRVVEIPIHFTDRRFGASKLTLAEQLKYLQHVRRLYVHRFGGASPTTRFLVVGLSGLVVNLLLLTLLLAVRLPWKAAVILAIGVSMAWNFGFGRWLGGADGRREPVGRELVAYVSTALLAALLNYLVTVATWYRFEYKQLAAAAGVAAGMGLNFMGSRYLAFRRRHIAPAAPERTAQPPAGQAP